MSNENFISEINEELRSDRLRNFWRRFGPWVIAAAVLIVVGVAGKEGWDWYSNGTTARSSDQFYAALKVADGSDVAAAQKALDDLQASGSGAYPLLAKFREAALLAKSGKTADAVAAYNAIATGQPNKHLRSVALVLAAYLLVDGGDVASVQQRLIGLDAPEEPLRNAAREVLGLVKYKAGDLEGARQSFQEVVDDPLSSSQLRQRVQVYLAQLVSQGISKPDDTAAATPAAPATDTSATPAATTTAPATATSVGDAPALDTTPPADTAPAGTTAPADTMAPAGTMAPADSMAPGGTMAPADTMTMSPGAGVVNAPADGTTMAPADPNAVAAPTAPMSPANTLEPAPTLPLDTTAPATTTPVAPAN